MLTTARLAALTLRLRAQRLDEEAAQVYEEFVTSFDAGGAQAGPKAFVRGGVVEPGSRPSSEPTRARVHLQQRARGASSRLARLRPRSCSGQKAWHQVCAVLHPAQHAGGQQSAR